MSNGNIPVIKFVFRGELKALDDALGVKPGYEVDEFSTANELATHLATIPASLIIASLRDRNDLIQLATFLKIVKKIARDAIMKVVVVNFSGDKNFEKASDKLGIQDLIEPNMNTRALKYKLDFWMKSLNVQLKSNANSGNQKIKSLDAKKTDSKTVDKNAATWLEPLDLESDIWILKNDNDCKKVMSKWLVRLMGPGPYVGQWVEAGSGHWRFDFKENQKEFYIADDGSWFLSGDQRPEFVWKENIWLITGDNFDLYFKDQTAKIHSRLKSQNKNLTICKNSLFAKTKESLIIESFDKDMVFKKEVSNLEDLEGKNKTDHLNGGPLSGKNKSSEALKGNLAGKTEGEAALSDEALGLDTKTEKKSSYWNNKNSYQEEAASDALGPKSEGLRQGSNLEQNLSDQAHHKFYKNHNEHEKFDTPEAKEKAARDGEAGDPAGNLNGKSSTDKIPAHYKNDNRSEEKDRSSKEEALSGASTTDKLKSHYGQDNADKNQSREKDQREEKANVNKKREEKSISQVDREGNATTDGYAELEDDRKENLNTTATHKEREEKASVNKKREEKSISQIDREGNANTDGYAELEDERKENLNTTATQQEREEKENATNSVHMRDRSENAKNKHQEARQQSKLKGKHGQGKSKKDNLNFERKESASQLEDLENNNSYKDQTTGGNRLNRVLPFNKDPQEKKEKSPEEKELDEITRDAKVSAILTQNNTRVNCELDDFFDEQIIFTTTTPGITPDFPVNLDMLFKFLERDSKIKMQGDVLTVENDGEGTSFVTVKISQANAQALDTFMKLYTVRQQNINEFFKKAKGL
jgi:hypothetical protein